MDRKTQKKLAQLSCVTMREREKRLLGESENLRPPRTIFRPLLNSIESWRTQMIAMECLAAADLSITDPQ